MEALSVMNKLPMMVRMEIIILFGATIFAIVGGLSLLWPGTILDMMWKLNPAARTEFMMGGKLTGGLLLLCLGIMGSLADIGLLKGKTWSWWLTLLLLLIIGVINVSRLVSGDPGEIFGTPFTLGLIWLHVHPNVRKSYLSW
jgi:hypothetical protein